MELNSPHQNMATQLRKRVALIATTIVVITVVTLGAMSL